MPDKFLSKDRRIKLTLNDAHLLRRNEEKRHHFKLELNLSEDGSLPGMPEWIQSAFTHLTRVGNHASMQRSDVTLEGMSIEMWPTEKARTRFFAIVTGVTLSSFAFSRTGKTDEDAVVTMSFSAHFPARKEIHDWTYDQKTGDFYASFEQAQTELDLEGDPTAAREAAAEEEQSAVAKAKRNIRLI